MPGPFSQRTSDLLQDHEARIWRWGVSPFAVVALAGAFDLGGGPLEGGADLVGLDLSDRALVALGVSQLRWQSRPVTITRLLTRAVTAAQTGAGII
jgi:hypothetical protein